jgi:hypothetical protein
VYDSCIEVNYIGEIIMSSVFIERKEDGTLVQQFIWDKVGCDWNEFAGVEGLSTSDLILLKGLIDAELYSKEK